MIEADQMHFMDGGNVPLERSLDAALRGLETSLDEALDWDAGSIVMLGVVSKSSLGALGVIEFRFLDVVPVGVQDDFTIGLPIMAEAFVGDVRASEDNVTGLLEHLEPGFLGWVMVTQGWDAEEKTPEGDRIPMRMIGYYDIGITGFWVSSRHQGGDVQCGWGAPDGEDGVYGALRKMTEASHFLRIGRDLIGQ